MMIVGAVFVIVYTFIGGFLAESASDFMQAIVMIVALAVLITATVARAESARCSKTSRAFPDFGFLRDRQPGDGGRGQQLSAAGAPL